MGCQAHGQHLNCRPTPTFLDLPFNGISATGGEKMGRFVRRPTSRAGWAVAKI